MKSTGRILKNKRDKKKKGEGWKKHKEKLLKRNKEGEKKKKKQGAKLKKKERRLKKTEGNQIGNRRKHVLIILKENVSRLVLTITLALKGSIAITMRRFV